MILKKLFLHFGVFFFYLFRLFMTYFNQSLILSTCTNSIFWQFCFINLYQFSSIFIDCSCANLPILVTILNILKTIVESIFINLFPSDYQLQKRSDYAALILTHGTINLIWELFLKFSFQNSQNFYLLDVNGPDEGKYQIFFHLASMTSKSNLEFENNI